MTERSPQIRTGRRIPPPTRERRPGALARVIEVKDSVVRKLTQKREPVQNDDITLDMRLFRPDTGTGGAGYRPETGRGGEIRGRGGDRESTRPQEAIIPEQVAAQYQQFLYNHIQELNNFRINQENYFNQVMASGQHSQDRRIFYKLAAFEATGQHLDAERTRQNVERFFNTREGWFITTLLMQHKARLVQGGLGIVMETCPPRERDAVLQNMLIRLGRGQGRLDRLWRDLTPGQRRGALVMLGITAGTAAIGSAAGTLAGGGLAGAIRGAIALGTAGAAVGGGAGLLGHETRPGVQAQVRQSPASLNTIRTDPVEFRYLKYAMQIDIDDIQPTVGGVTAANRISETGNIEEKLRQVVEMIHTRNEFLQAIGAHPDTLDTMPDETLGQWTPDARLGENERTGTYLEMRVREIFNANRDGIRDRAGNTREHRPGGPGTAWVPNPAFDTRPVPLGNGVDRVGNYNRWMNAQRLAMHEYLDAVDERDIEIQHDLDMDAAITDIQNGITARQDGGEVVNQRRQALQAERTLLEEVNNGREGRNGLQQERAVMETYATAIQQLEAARTNARREFGAATVADIRTKIDTRNAGLRDPGVADSIAERRRNLNANIRNAIDADVATITSPKGSEAFRRQSEIITQEVTTRYQNDSDAIERDQGVVEREIARLQELQTQIEDAQQQLEQGADAVTQAQEVSRNMETDLNYIINIDTQLVNNRLAVVGLQLADFRVETFNELLMRVNRGHQALLGVVSPLPNPPGWPAEQNNRQDFRRILANAIAQARAESAEASFGVPSADFVTIQTHLTELEILSYVGRPGDLLTEYGNRAGAHLAWPDPRTEAVIAETRRRMNARNRGLREAMEANMRRSDLLDAQDATVPDTLEAERNNLEAVQALVQRREHVVANIQTIYRDIDRFTDVNPLTGPGGPGAADADYAQFTTAEQNARDAAGNPYERGYFALMRYLFDYRSAAEFERARQLMGPDRLTQVMYDQFRSYLVGIAPPPPPTLNDVLGAFRTAVSTGRANAHDIRRGFRAIIQNETLTAAATVRS